MRRQTGPEYSTVRPHPAPLDPGQGEKIAQLEETVRQLESRIKALEAANEEAAARTREPAPETEQIHDIWHEDIKPSQDADRAQGIEASQGLWVSGGTWSSQRNGACHDMGVSEQIDSFVPIRSRNDRPLRRLLP
ncbi:MAG: hypothetical protein AAGJ94_16710 [Pseudomonadota bacterium]